MHIDRASLDIGLQEYDHEAWEMLIVFSALIYFTVHLINKDRRVAALHNFGLLLIAAILIYFGASVLPEI